jgi:O-antigen ligase
MEAKSLTEAAGALARKSNESLAARRGAGKPPNAVSQWLRRVVFYGLLVAVGLAAVPYGTAEPWSQSLYGVFVFVLTALALAEIAVSRSWPRSGWLWLMPPLALMLLLMLAQTLSFGSPPALPLSAPVWWTVSFDPYETRFAAFRLLTLMLTGALLFRYTDSPRRLRALVFLVVGIAVLSAGFALARMAGQRTEGFILPRLPVGEKRAGQFISRNHFAFMLEMALGLLLGLAAGRGVRREKLALLLGPALLLWAVLVMSGSRGGLLALVAQIAFIGLLFGAVSAGSELSRSWALRGVLFAVLLVGVVGGTLFLGGDDLASRLSDSAAEINNSQAFTARDKTNRAEIWRATLQMFKERPLLGVGLGGYWTAIPAYHDASGRLTPRQAHNDYLEILASGGVIGFALAAWFLILLVKRIRRQLNSPDTFRRAVCFGASAGLFGVAVHSLLDFGLHITINALLFTVLVVLATAGGGIARHSSRRETATLPPTLAYAGAVAGALLCLWGAWGFGWMGFSRLLGDYARIGDSRAPQQFEAAQSSVAATPNDADAHSALGLTLLAQQRPAEALQAFAQAIAVRPRDYVLWLQLGRAQDITGREKEAAAPFREAARLAPRYAQPPWQLGNLLFRRGQTAEGLAEMRRAAQSDPELFPVFTDLAWGASEGDAAKVIATVNPERNAERLALGRYLLKKERIGEAVAQFRAAGELPAPERERLIQDFFNAKAFREAYELRYGNKPAGLVNGDFEEETRAGETAFGWRWQKNEPGVAYALDPNQPHGGKYSFSLTYKNQDNPERETLAQLVAVEPGARYRLTFAARAANMAAASWPTLYVADAAQGGTYIGKTEIRAGEGWQNYAAEFTTSAKTGGVTLYLRRPACDGGPCALFGTLWLDSFVLKKN